MQIHFTRKISFKISTNLVVAFIISIILPLNVIAKQFPDLGNEYRNSTLSISDEKLIGDAWMQKLRASNAVCADPIINSYLNHLGQQLIVHADVKSFNFMFFCIEDYSINAFAFFGGHIGIHKGLILAAQNENELAAAIAHEIAHISQEHLIRQIIKNKQFIPITVAGALASAILGVPDLMIPILATHEQRMINFTREHEQEADNIGMQLLADAGFEPQSMATLFTRMRQNTQYNANIPEYLLTHPVFETRISESQHRANHFNYSQHPNSSSFHLIKARIESSENRNKQEILYNFKERLAKNRYDDENATLYGYALALAANNEYSHAHKILQELATLHPNNLVIQLGLIDTEIAQQDRKCATKRMEDLLTIFPDDPALILKYSANLIASKEVNKAKPWLLKLSKTKAAEPLTYQLLAEAESISGNNIGMHTATAEWDLLYGELDNAVIQLNMALELIKNNNSLKASIEKRKIEIKKLIIKMKSL